TCPERDPQRLLLVREEKKTLEAFKIAEPALHLLRDDGRGRERLATRVRRCDCRKHHPPFVAVIPSLPGVHLTRQSEPRGSKKDVARHLRMTPRGETRTVASPSRRPRRSRYVRRAPMLSFPAAVAILAERERLDPLRDLTRGGRVAGAS